MVVSQRCAEKLVYKKQKEKEKQKDKEQLERRQNDGHKRRRCELSCFCVFLNVFELLIPFLLKFRLRGQHDDGSTDDEYDNTYARRKGVLFLVMLCLWHCLGLKALISLERFF